MSLAIILVICIIVQAILLLLVMPLMFYCFVLNEQEREEFKKMILNKGEKK